ncbi:MAG: sodium/proton-translocating pyrophosphatase [Gemmatimonadales bacterium]
MAKELLEETGWRRITTFYGTPLVGGLSAIAERSAGDSSGSPRRLTRTTRPEEGGGLPPWSAAEASAAGGAVIYWFTGASMAVTTGAYRAVEYIKANIKLEGVEKASVEDSRKVVEICTQYAQKGMFNIFLGVFSILAFAFVEPFFFTGYLISIAMSGLYQKDLHGQCRRRLG